MNKIGKNFKSRRLASFAIVAGFVSLVIVVATSGVGAVSLAAPRALGTAPTLGAAGSFAVLAASAVTNTGATIVGGDLGINPNNASSITGFPPGLVTGTIHAADGVALQAQNDVTTAYNNLASQICDTTFTAPTDLGGMTLTPGVYCFGSSAGLTGKLTLNGNSTDVWVFKIGSALTTSPGSSVVFTGAQSCNVFWQVTSSATLDTTTRFAGNILALASITIKTSASLSGRALARTGAVTMDTNNVSFPVCALPAATATNTPPPSTATAIAATQTAIAATRTATLTPTATATPTSTPTALPATLTAIPPTLTAIVATQTALAATQTVIIAPTLTAIAATQTVLAATQTVIIAPTLTAIAATQTALAPTATPQPTATSRPAATEIPQIVPATGFDPGSNTILSKQPANKAYAALGDLWLEIPRLGVQMSIVGVPQADGQWDVSWLGQDAGWLQGSAFPTWAGNSVITGHVWNADNTAGPFRYINTMWWGDKIIVHAWGGQYVYEVRAVTQVAPGNTAAMLKHEEHPWVTLVTCREYDAVTNSYKYRVLVRAVLVEVK